MPTVENLSAPSAALAVIGCGNLNRRDDGLGVIVAQRLQQWLNAEPTENVQVFDAGTGGMEVMFQARGSSALILVDASLSGSPPGSIFKVPGQEVASRPEPSYSLHDFRWDHALYTGRKIFGAAFPHDVTVYLVEAADVSLGLELSHEVSQAIERVLDQIKDEIRERSKRSRSGQSASCNDDRIAARSEDRHQVTIKQGSIYLDAKVYATYLGGLESIVLLRQDQKLLLVPVRHAAAGGLLMKVRNPQGDRVVHAQEFLRGHGIEDQQEWVGTVRWDSRAAALVTDWPS